MPATRRSPRRKAKADEEKHQEEEEEVEEESDDSEQEQESSSRNNARDSASRRSTSRELRKRRRDELKTKSMGVGLSISKNAFNSNKIVFDDNEDFDGDHTAGEDVAEQVQEDARDEDSESDDDAIEEVKSSVARDKAMDQLARERETALEQKVQTKTKKRKAKATPAIEEEEDFDEDFFAQVDSEMAEQRKQRKLDKLSVPTGRHTTFLSTEEEADSRPIQAEHNIELVVLGNDTEGPTSANSTLLDSTSDKAGIEPSEASHLFARDRLRSGKANKKGTKKKKQTDAGWRRSKKMNVLAFGRTKAKRSNGRAAANFVVN